MVYREREDDIVREIEKKASIQTREGKGGGKE